MPNSKDYKVLILTPNLKFQGGVASLYNILNLTKNKNIEYFNVQGNKRGGKLLKPLNLFGIYFCFILKVRRFNIVQLNPSLNKNSYHRDGLFILISRLFRKKIIVYWHGWNHSFQKTLIRNGSYTLFHRITYKKANLHIVLGSSFKNELLKMSILDKNIKIESNAADDSFLKKEIFPIKKTERIELLFMSRIEEQKGIYIVLKVMQILKNLGEYHLTIAGSGSELSNVKTYINDHMMSNISVLGHVEGYEKHKILSQSHIMILPSFSEGMPLSIIEAMLYGLVIVSRPIGGISDWVNVPNNGFLIESLDESDYAEVIHQLSLNPIKMKEIQESNRKLALGYYTPKALEERLFNYYNLVLNS